ncbi:MAG: protoheme IX farnesyltransferase [Marinicaulis sp.]|nr:heme o synthase [Marinicaulis sp.]NNE40242.1 protoheme IX farnesyltransferase [Marinicaulis sp.]NNL90149.1 protoheme IX farnesyltransferase [Marinicaulis sp.]
MTDNAAKSDSYALAGPEDFFDLLKPRVMSLVVFTAFVGMVAAPGGIHPLLGLVSILAIAVGAGASGALNMWWDADIDAVMSRTANRPIPAGKVRRGDAGAFGGFLSALSVVLLALSSNYLAAGLLAFTIFFYVVIYSMILKRATPQNIVIGGAAGAFPPVIGWAAVTGNAPLEAWILFAIIFLWTPPHFWALALYKQGDYERVGVPMMPNVKGDAATRQQILAYSIILFFAGLAPLATNIAGVIYGIAATGLGAGFLWFAYKVYQGTPEDHGPAKKLFGFSIFYLFGVFLALLIEKAVKYYV